jgi:hypothetical protein
VVEGEERRYLEARGGDHLLCPFECDDCVFFKLRGRKPREGDSQDDLLSAYIRRANLDAFWAREPKTVSGHVREVRASLKTGEELGIPMFGAIGPWPAQYDHGHRTAIAVLAKTRRPGRHETFMKHSSARKARTASTNLWHASAAFGAEAQVWRIDGKKRVVSSSGPLDSEWYERFATGIKSRLGERVKQDAAVSAPVMAEVLRLLDEDFLSFYPGGLSPSARLGPAEVAAARRVVESGCFCVLSYCVGLRGFEVPRVILDYLRLFRYREADDRQGIPPQIGVPLAGRFKLRGGMDQNLLLFLAAVTRSGIQALVWIDRLVEVLEREFEVTSGWAFQKDNGAQLRMSDFEESIFDKFLEVQEKRPDLIPPEFDVLEEFGLARSFRRGSTTEAKNQAVDEDDIDFIMRWKDGKDTTEAYFSGSMQAHYADQRQMAKSFLRFSLAL